MSALAKTVTESDLGRALSVLPMEAALEHLRACHPVDYDMLGEKEDVELVKNALAESLGCGFTTAEEHLRFLDLAVMFGLDLTEDPTLPWVQPALSSSQQGSARARALWAAALKYLDEVAGERGEDYLMALLRASKLSPLPLATPSWTNDEAVAALQHVYPRKLRAMGDGVKAFLERGRKRTLEVDSAATGISPILLLAMLFLGTSFERDPRYPWAGVALSGKGSAPPFAALVKAALGELEHAFALLRAERRFEKDL